MALVGASETGGVGLRAGVGITLVAADVGSAGAGF